MIFSNLNELLKWTEKNQSEDWEKEEDVLVGETIFPSIISALEAFVI